MSERKNTPNPKGRKTHVIYRHETSRRGLRTTTKFAGYAYDGKVYRDGKAVAVQDYVDTLSANAPSNVGFAVEEC
jgi:hypothetical protein